MCPTKGHPHEAKLEKLKIGMMQRISEAVIQNIDMDVLVEQMSETFVYQLRSFVWSEPVGKHEIKHPLTWWDAFKERWFYPWMLKRWPVVYKVHDIDWKVLYPEFKPVLGNCEVHVYRMYGDSWDTIQRRWGR